MILSLSSSTTVDSYLENIPEGHAVSPIFSQRVEALFKLKMFDEIITLINVLLTILEKKIPFSPTFIDCTEILLRILMSEVKTMTGRGEESIHHLHILEQRILTHIKLHSSTDNSNCQSHHDWLYVLWAVKVNLSIRQHQPQLAVVELNNILNYVQSDTYLRSKYLIDNLIYVQITINCQICRIYAQVYILITRHIIVDYPLILIEMCDITDWSYFSGPIEL
jgi:hypothetical protein